MLDILGQNRVCDSPVTGTLASPSSTAGVRYLVLPCPVSDAGLTAFQQNPDRSAPFAGQREPPCCIALDKTLQHRRRDGRARDIGILLPIGATGDAEQQDALGDAEALGHILRVSSNVHSRRSKPRTRDRINSGRLPRALHCVGARAAGRPTRRPRRPRWPRRKADPKPLIAVQRAGATAPETTRPLGEPSRIGWKVTDTTSPGLIEFG
jgi:hypothetical protein